MWRAVIAQPEGDADGKVGWRVEIELSEDPEFTRTSPTAGSL